MMEKEKVKRILQRNFIKLLSEMGFSCREISDFFPNYSQVSKIIRKLPVSNPS